MNSQDLKTQVKLLEEKEELLSSYRKLKCSSNLALFIQEYLYGLTPSITPAFHKEIIQLIQPLAHTLQRTTTPIQGDTAQKTASTSTNKQQANTDKITASGMDDPPLPPETGITTTPHFFEEKKELALTRESKRVLIIAPRGFAKSTLVSRFFTLWLACYGKRKDIFLVSATISLAKEHLRIIRQELEVNDLITRDFGHLKSDKWTEEILVLRNGTTIRAKGRGFQIRGFRPDMIICDDLEDEEVIYSKDQRDKLEHWFFRTLLPSLKPDQSLLYVGTKIHQQSLMSKLEVKEEFLVRMYKALTDGKSIWEEYWPTDRLESLRKELGMYAFEAEYQNNPISLAEQPIKPHYLDGVKIEGDVEVMCLAIDPAISEKESSDYRAFSLFARTSEGFREVFTERGRWGIYEQVDRIIDIWEKFEMKPENCRIVIEEVAFQKVYRSILTKEARKKGLFLPISGAELGVGLDKRPKDKVTRLISVSHLFEQRLVEIVNPELRDELISFPSGDYDDLVDATVFALYYLMTWRKGGFMTMKEKEGLTVGTKKSYYVREVRPGVFMSEQGIPPLPRNSRIINYDKNA